MHKEEYEARPRSRKSYDTYNTVVALTHHTWLLTTPANDGLGFDTHRSFKEGIGFRGASTACVISLACSFAWYVRSHSRSWRNLQSDDPAYHTN